MKDMTVSVQVPPAGAGDVGNMLVSRHLDWFSSLQQPDVVELRAGGGLELCLGAQLQPAPNAEAPLLDDCYVDLAPIDSATLNVDGVHTRSMRHVQQRTLQDEEAARIMAGMPMAPQLAAAACSTPEERAVAAAESLLCIAVAEPRTLTRSKAARSKLPAQHHN